MSRLLALALAALILPAVPAAAQEQPKKESAPPAEKPAATELDAKTQAAIQRELEKMKEDLRNEVRAEIQGAQSAAEFLGAVAEGPKLEFLELDGYLRVRGQLTGRADLDAGTDEAGYFLYPVPLQGRGEGDRATLATANMRLRLEPTLNVSEHVRVRMQTDILDNYVLGSSTSRLFTNPYSAYPVPFYGSTRGFEPNDATADRDAILVKRAWAEIQTPVGLLSFGRMPSHWGLGVMANAGGDIDDDYGDTVDRIQFALPPVSTPIGRLSFAPILDFDDEGVLNPDPRFGAGTGQPFDAESGDDGRTYALKVARLDTDDEIRRKLERDESSFNFGAYYNYRTQRWFYPTWYTTGYGPDYSDDGDPSTGAGNATDEDPAAIEKVKRNAYAHIVDFWGRWLSGRWRVESEVALVYGNVDAVTSASGRIGLFLRQWGGSLQTEYAAIPNKVALRAELGIASGDSAPGFGNVPNRLAPNGDGTFRLPPFGAAEGPQFGLDGDRDIRNFRFNPAYDVDLLLWRRILGNVTDAWYLKPGIRWDIFPGLSFDGAIVYSQALYGESTPSARQTNNDVEYEPNPEDPDATPVWIVNYGKKALGIEVDGRLTYTSGDGFGASLAYGILQPLGGMGAGDLKRGHALEVGLSARF
jgi:uncharacterized protein (TIGR04551 family)